MVQQTNNYEAQPIPSYDEANAQSSRNRSLDERIGLLSRNSQSQTRFPARHARYRPPTVEDATDDDDDELPSSFRSTSCDGIGIHHDDEENRREIEELEIEGPNSGTNRNTWGKRISSLSQRLHIPFRMPFKWKWELRLPQEINWPKVSVNICLVLIRTICIILIVTALYMLLMSDIFAVGTQRMQGQIFDPEKVRIHVQSMMNEDEIRDNLRTLTKADHVAGTKGDFMLAQYLAEFFKRNYLEDVRTEEYEVYLNFPKNGGRKVNLLKEDGAISWSAKIEEDYVYTNPSRPQAMIFHGHSKSGDVTGPLIYANYGSRSDFKVLHDSGISTQGAVALVRHSGNKNNLAMKVKAAELVGFVGCIIYNDPLDDGFLKGDVAPNGRYRPEDSVQAGTVSLTSWAVGDVLTPGWASVPGAERISKENNTALVNIPSISLSSRDAQNLLAAIQGFGEASPEEWRGGIPKIEYWTGNLSSPKVHLVNVQDEVEQQPIWNVLGKISGVEQREKSIIVGNHRDSWQYGASSPGSGTAVMMEIIRIFGDLSHRGWRPLRTIEFASWDGGEYNFIGSTEWVEDHVEDLRKDAYVYLNVDSAVSGSDFHATGNPVFTKSLIEVLKRTSDPRKNKTMIELWQERGCKIDSAEARSDNIAFQDIAGTSSIDIGFTGGVFPFHSAYDNFEWIDAVGDPGFVYHKILAQIWALLILEYSDQLILPFDMSTYSSSLAQWVVNLSDWAENKGINQDGNIPWNIAPLQDAALQFANDTRRFQKWEEEWSAIVYGGGGYETLMMAEHRKSHNNRMANFETHLLDLEEDGGIPNRTQFKHVLFGPQLWTGDEQGFFPAIRDAVLAGEWELVQSQVAKVASVLKKASAKLVGNT
ncbi:hypothetical protein K3495_g2384 [Podosphaera aphanis]|nr:hypothetical protein K3495_g2384 [Podosphaera aphanis]